MDDFGGDALHESGRIRFAYTEQWAKRQNFPPNLDRLIHRYQLPPEIVPGWRMLGSIMIPESSLPERSSAESKKVQWWEVPNTGFAMTYQIFVSSSDDSIGPVVMGVGRVGSFLLDRGGYVMVVAKKDFAPLEQAIQAERVRQYESNKREGKTTDDDFLDLLTFSWVISGRGVRV